MTKTQIKARLDKIEAAIHPEADPSDFVWLGWADDPIPPEYADAPVITLRWPEDLQNSGAGALSPLGLPKAG
jgi:hypothetical protein